MPVKTRDGWKTVDQVRRQEKAWKKARSSLMEKLGTEATQSEDATKKRGEEIFREMDTDGNGSIDMSELKSAFSKVGVTLSTKEVKMMMTEADEDG